MREVNVKYSKGTFIKTTDITDLSSKSKNLDQKYVLSFVANEENEFGVCFFDLTTLEFFGGCF